MSDTVALAIIAAAQKFGYGPEQTIAVLATAEQESTMGDADSNIFQQDASYPDRGTLAGNIAGFFTRLNDKLALGTTTDLWKVIFWLQQAPSYETADSAFADGRQAYLGEIQGRIGTATGIYNRLTTSNVAPPVPPTPVPAVTPEPPAPAPVAGIPEANLTFLWNVVINPRLGADYQWGTFDCSMAVSQELEALVNGAPAMDWDRQFSTMTFAGANPGDTGPFGGSEVTRDLVCIASPADAPPDAAAIIAVRQGASPEDSHMIISVPTSLGGPWQTIEMGGPPNNYHLNVTAIDDPEFNQWFALPGPIIGEEPTPVPTPAVIDWNTPLASLSPYADPDEGAVLTLALILRYADARDDQRYVEDESESGDAESLARLRKTAALDLTRYPERAAYAARAQRWLDHLQTTPTPPGADPVPVPPPSKVTKPNLLHALIALIGGGLITGALLGLQTFGGHLTPGLTAAVASAIAVAIGFLHILVKPKTPPQVVVVQPVAVADTTQPTPAPAPTPDPAPAPTPEPAPTQPMPALGTLADEVAKIAASAAVATLTASQAATTASEMKVEAEHVAEIRAKIQAQVKDILG